MKVEHTTEAESNATNDELDAQNRQTHLQNLRRLYAKFAAYPAPNEDPEENLILFFWYYLQLLHERVNEVCIGEIEDGRDVKEYLLEEKDARKRVIAESTKYLSETNSDDVELCDWLLRFLTLESSYSVNALFREVWDVKAAFQAYRQNIAKKVAKPSCRTSTL